MVNPKKDVLAYLSSVKEMLNEIINISNDILKIIWNNKLTFTILLLLYVFYLSLNYVAYEMPKRTIYKYYNLLDKHQNREAWNLLTPQCQVRWSDAFNGYNEGYSTLATTKILNIDNYNPGTIKEALLSDKKQLTIEIIVIENFKNYNVYDTIKKQIKTQQNENLYWLTLKYGQPKVDSLKSNSLSSYRSALKLVRRYRKVFTIQVNPNADFIEKALSNNWLITDIADKETSLFYDTTFFYK